MLLNFSVISKKLFHLSIATDNLHETAETAHFIFRRELKTAWIAEQLKNWGVFLNSDNYTTVKRSKSDYFCMNILLIRFFGRWSTYTSLLKIRCVTKSTLGLFNYCELCSSVSLKSRNLFRIWCSDSSFPTANSSASIASLRLFSLGLSMFQPHQGGSSATKRIRWMFSKISLLGMNVIWIASYIALSQGWLHVSSFRINKSKVEQQSNSKFSPSNHILIRPNKDI